MTTRTIDRLHAVSVNDGRPVHIPTHLNPVTLVTTLAQLLPVPTTISAAVSKGAPLKAVGHRFSVEEVDAALFQGHVGISDRMRLKVAMRQSGIL